LAKNSRVLVISDTHCPYHHQDTVKFLKAIKDKYDPDRVIHIGDEIDNHAMSFHPSDQSLYSAGDELKAAREAIWQIEELYPKVEVMESNHGSMAYRKAMVAGIPKEILRPYHTVLDVKNWTWHPDLVITLPDKSPCYFHHGKSANSMTFLKDVGMSCVQGHYHEKYNIQYHGRAERLTWTIATGCLIDDHSMAFAYNTVNLKRPIIGCSIILDSQPHLLPMVLNRKGRWTGRLT
jgi:hypothetical protein